jgi:archaellum component FlaC
MIEKFTIPLLLFFNGIGLTIDPSLTNEKVSIGKVRSEIKSLERKIQLTEVIEEDFASKSLKIEKYKKNIGNLKTKIEKIEKVAKLKEIWAHEDSLESITQKQK